MKKVIFLITLVASLVVLNVACVNDGSELERLTRADDTNGNDNPARMTFANESELYAAITDGIPVCTSDEMERHQNLQNG